MDCQTARELLSAYFDDELAQQSADKVDLHLENCVECRQEIGRYRQLSQLAGQLKTISGPDQFAEIQQALKSPRGQGLVMKSPFNRTRWRAAAVAATATVLLLLTVSSWFWCQHSHGMEASFNRFLGAFKRSPEQAENVLSEIYAGQVVSLEDAEKILKYRPVVAQGLPPGYSLTSAYVIKMPCCVCLQANLRTATGRGIAVFEHDGHQPHWFGNRPAIDTVCQGQPTRLIQLDGSVAATCRCGQRYLTVIGPQDLGEVDQLIGFWNRMHRAANSTNRGLLVKIVERKPLLPQTKVAQRAT